MEVTFIDEEGPKIHDGLGGPSRLDEQGTSYIVPTPHVKLDLFLREYVSLRMDIVVPDNTWDTVYDKLVEGENRLQQTDKGIRQLFVKVGDHADTIMPFIDLIPNEYGLSVVRAGIALVIHYAVRQSEKRAKIYDAFASVRDTIADARSFRRSFYTDSAISDCAVALYESVAQTVEKLFQYVPMDAPKDPKRRDRWTRLLRSKQSKENKENKEKLPDLDTVLDDMKSKAKNLQRQVEGAGRERQGQILATVTRTEQAVDENRWCIEKTYIDTMKGHIATQSQLNSFGADFMAKLDEQAKIQEEREEEHEKKRAEQDAEIKRHLEQFLMNCNADLKNSLLQSLQQDKISREAEIESIVRRQLEQEQPQWKRNQSVRTVSPDQLLLRFKEAIVEKQPSQASRDTKALLLHPLNDLEIIATRKDFFDNTTQAQAHSLLQNQRFLHWMQSPHSDLLLVDGNSPTMAASSSNVSALSLLCATLIAKMAGTYVEDLVMSFFCGLHGSSFDPWGGPNGLLRSLIIQVLLFLVSVQQTWSMDIWVNDPELCVDGFLSDNPNDLGEVLHYLLTLLPQGGLTVFCLIDGVSCFDKDYNDQFDKMQHVFGWLQHFADTGGYGAGLPVRFKTMLTHPGRSTKRLRGLVNESQHIVLNPSMPSMKSTSDLSVENQVRTASYVDPTTGRYEDDWD